MDTDLRRLALGAFGLLLLAVMAYVTLNFIAALTIAVFVYYATRPIYKWLGLKTDRLPRARAVLTILFFSVPLVGLIAYTTVLILTELRNFLGEAPLESLGIGEQVAFGEVTDIDMEAVLQAYQAGEFDTFISLLSENLSAVAAFVSSFFLNVLVVVIITYYLLIEGARIRRKFRRYDNGVLTKYAEAADAELKSVLFGNLLNVIVISIVAIAVYTGYNLYVPEPAQVPAPVLAGALTGLASLIPVVGMKIVYVPLALVPVVNVLIDSRPELLVYVVGFVVVAVVLVDTVPDLLLRPYISGETTHVGLLMLAYIFGPVVFGFYGLFLVPIVLVLTLTFADEALPYLLGKEDYQGKPIVDPNQRTLEDFGE